MSMVKIGWKTTRGVEVVEAHYHEGVLDWEKYHEQEAKRLKATADRWGEDDPIEARFKSENLELSKRAKKASWEFDPTYAHGCETMAGTGGFWRCNTPQEEAKWRKNKREHCTALSPFLEDKCALFLNFNSRHAIIRSLDYTNWENFLPDGWTFKIAV